MPLLYEELLHKLTKQGRGNDEAIGILLTGSFACGYALPGTGIDLRFVLIDGVDRPFDNRPLDGVPVERTYADAKTELAKLETSPMNFYAHLDGRILHDPQAC
jgi:hypothetical protein